MGKEFIPYELAVKLKELGFDEPSIATINNIQAIHVKGTRRLPSGSMCTEEVKAPLWQQAFDFLLKKYNLYGVLIPTVTMHWTFKTMTVVECIVEVPPYKKVDGNDYSSVEEARQACLEKLIQLVEDDRNNNK